RAGAGGRTLRAPGRRDRDRVRRRRTAVAGRSPARRPASRLRPVGRARGADDEHPVRHRRARRRLPAHRAGPRRGGSSARGAGGRPRANGGMSASLEAYLARLYLDRDTRRAFLADPGGAASKEALDDADVAALERIDRVGLELTARSLAARRSLAPPRGRIGRWL